MKRTKKFVMLGRIFSVLSLLAFILTWFSSTASGNILGRSEAHLFYDAIIMALLGIFFLIDGFLHSKQL